MVAILFQHFCRNTYTNTQSTKSLIKQIHAGFAKKKEILDSLDLKTLVYILYNHSRHNKGVISSPHDFLPLMTVPAALTV